jgi:hypothetical protein
MTGKEFIYWRIANCNKGYISLQKRLQMMIMGSAKSRLYKA